MDLADFTSSQNEKELLRKREIETQMNELHSPAPNARATAARRLGDLQAGLDDLVDALHDPSEIVRGAAAMALGNFQGDARSAEIIDYLLATIDDASEKVCQSAIRSLGMLHAASARSEIEDFLDDPNPYILGAAILALARLGAEDLAARLAGYLSHESTYVKMQAARAIGVLKYAPAGPIVTRLLEKTRSERNAGGFTDPAAHIDRREDDLYNLQNQLIRAAGELQLKDAVPLLLEIARKDIGFRGLAVEALVAIGAEIDLELLARLLTDPSVYLRKRLIQLMTDYDYQPALPLIRSMLRDDNVTIRVAALQAIARMRDTTSLQRLGWMCYHDPNPFIRVQALHSLVAMQGREVAPHMLALAKDVNYQVRRAAVAYLLEWGLPGDASIRAATLFRQDFPEDPMGAVIQSAVQQRGYDASVSAERETPEPPEVPPQIQADSKAIQEVLEHWLEAIRQEASIERKESEAALAYLIGLLSKKESSGPEVE